ncbi:hypothetical protein Clst_0719 [Thermoclostridium stercorarium subsp. stercorarium DSM 8532]|nr:hypothetical protein Clst_0719 [Thermoclostridium stercorarium subsp. stercorarium DSM 8532]
MSCYPEPATAGSKLIKPVWNLFIVESFHKYININPKRENCKEGSTDG